MDTPASIGSHRAPLVFLTIAALHQKELGRLASWPSLDLTDWRGFPGLGDNSGGYRNLCSLAEPWICTHLALPNICENSQCGNNQSRFSPSKLPASFNARTLQNCINIMLGMFRQISSLAVLDPICQLANVISAEPG